MILKEQTIVNITCTELRTKGTTDLLEIAHVTWNNCNLQLKNYDVLIKAMVAIDLSKMR